MNDLVTITPAEARTVTDRIKAGVEAVWHLIEQAYTSRAWAVLGYSSWDDYCTREFGTSRIRLPREERQEVVASLRESGLSIRAIASATGESVGTVHNALSGVQNRTPEPVTGTDGKTYTQKLRPESEADPGPDPVDDRFITQDELDELNAPPNPQDTTPPAPATPASPKRKPITDSFFDAAYDLGRLTERIARLAADDRFEKNAGQIAQKNLGELTRSRDALQRVIDQLSQA